MTTNATKLQTFRVSKTRKVLSVSGRSPGSLRTRITRIYGSRSGIPENLRDRIFQPNFSTKTSGMGLGLAIVKKTVEDMHGTITFDSWEGAGTTFTIRLPAAGRNRP